MSKKLIIYISIVTILAVALLLFISGNTSKIDVFGIVFFSILSIIAESLLIITPGNRALSVGFVISMAVILLYGVPEAVWITTVGVMFRVVKSNGRRTHIFNYPLYKTIFNGACIILTTGITGLHYERLGGIPGADNLDRLLLPIAVSIIVYIITNATIISILMHIITGKTFFNIWYENIAWVLKSYFAMAPISVIIAMAYVDHGAIGVLIYYIPLLLARYSFKLYIDMKNIYIETVRALSQAMEAKDPCTQGHSMRVSQYACALAQKMGLSQRKIDNLRIAAILHDIGKIGVDESILNKRGRLSEDELSKIKLHPSIGVKIIQEIDFLKEATEIIISHHERIDGKGYPMGKSGWDIKMESCILSIADVFDALTSDRPYRSAMTQEQALAIIEEGKGTQFDALAVETFLDMISESKEMKGNVG